MILLATFDLDLMQTLSMSIEMQRKTEMHPITAVFAGINDQVHSRVFLSRLREPTTAGDAAWPAIKDNLEPMGEIIDTLKESAFQKKKTKPVFAQSPGWIEVPVCDGGVALGRKT